MRFVIVTGISGAGKSSVLKMLEDAGYFCADNLPIPLIPTFMQLSIESSERIHKIALGLDIRSGDLLDDVSTVLEPLRDKGCPYEILFLDAEDEVLVKRYKETRRMHPLAGQGRVDSGIEEERGKLAYLKQHADYIIDTSHMLIRDLKTEIDHIFVSNEEYNNIYITVLSFGFKYGIPTDCDLVLDVRFLPNPFYVDELKELTGNDAAVAEYVMNSPAAVEFLKKMVDLLAFLIPNYQLEGKNQLVIGIGCTGGKHRSVTLTNAIAKKLDEMDYSVKTEHRDIRKER